MRHTGFFAGLGVLAFAVSMAAAQGVIFNGIPASVTSVTPRNPSPGIPASATSLRPALPGQIGLNNGFGQPEFRRHRRVVVVPVAVPVYYPYAYDNPADYPSDAQNPVAQTVVETDAPGPVVYESRPVYRPPSSYEQTSQAAANQTVTNVVNTEPDPEPITILVFRDGHQLEIGNYAIVGSTLYNLTGNSSAHKILLADLNLDATARINEERGYDFRVPKQEGN